MNKLVTEEMEPNPRIESPDPSRTNRLQAQGRLPLIAAAAGCLYFVAHGVRVILGGEQRIMEWLYDDSFYYLITAKHFSEQHVPSFDGITLTSGYHPLWMWLCATIYHIHGRLDLTYVRCCMGLSLLITTVLLVVAVLYAARRRSSGLLWAIALGATSYSALNNGISVMEWPLVVLFWFLLHRSVERGLSERPERHAQMGAVAAFFIGAAGSLSRTDFGLIPVCYLAAAFLIGRRYGRWKAAWRATSALAGVFVGLATEFLYNHHMTGEWLQTSAEVKRTFASVTAPFNPAPALWQFLRVLLYLPSLSPVPSQRAASMSAGLHLLEIAVACAAVFVAVRWRWLKQRSSEAWASADVERLMLAAPVLGIVGYLLVYGLDSQATYGWYTATVTGFVLIGTGTLLQRRRTITAALIVLLLMAWNISAAEFFGGNAKGQMQEVASGKRMHAEHPNARMGGGDVGKPSFYNDGQLMNVDGLMNNEVYPYLISGTIQCYVLYRHIEYLSDIGSITVPLTDAERARHHEPPMPWSQYFVSIPATNTSGASNAYLKTDFDAIRASGECGRYNSKEAPVAAK